MPITTKTGEEIEILREGGHRLAEILRAVAKEVKAGVNTNQLDEIFFKLATAGGDTPAFLNYTPEGVKNPYPASLCTSVNDVIVHGIPSEDQILKDGDIITIDGGLIHKGMYTDHAISLIVGQDPDAKIQKEKEKFLNVCREALTVGIKAAKVGKTVGDIGSAIEHYLKPYGYGIVRELAGHGVGYKVHEDPYVPNYGKAGEGAKLVAGMVIAIEPMITMGTRFISFDRDGYTIRTKDHKLSAHFEHTIVIGADKTEILTV